MNVLQVAPVPSDPAGEGETPDDQIHPTYLPFSREMLRQHFASVRTGGLKDRHLRYYVESAQRALVHAPAHAARRSSKARSPMCSSLDHQIEKDERFWVVSALLTAFHNPGRVATLTRLLSEALGATPAMDGLASWAEALGDPAELRLFFEANLPAPTAYMSHAASTLEQRSLIPWQRERAATRKQLEGATKVDAILVAPRTEFAVVFEAKVLSDTSCHTTYDASRNQIARNIDVLLERHSELMPPLDTRSPERSCFVLLTPQLFVDNPSSRLYGRLMEEYRRESATLARDLPHRDPAVLAGLPSRLGWTSWERVNEIIPGACRWLDKPTAEIDV